VFLGYILLVIQLVLMNR